MLFLIIGVLFLMFFLFSTHYYLFGGLSAVSFLLYFILIGNGNWLSFLIFLLGMILIILEFFMPDFGLMGIVGAIMLVIGYFANSENVLASLRDASLGIILAAIVSGVLLKRGYRLLPGRASLILGSRLDRSRGYSTSKDYSQFIHQRGIATTTLRPSGKAVINGQVLDVVSDGLIIAEGREVEVIQVEGIKIIVKEI